MEDMIKILKTGYYISWDIRKQKVSNTRKISHYEVELYTTDGAISVINDVKYPQEKNNLLISRPGDVRYSIDHFECYCLHFSTKYQEINDAIKHLPCVFKPHATKKIADILKFFADVPPAKTKSAHLLHQAKLLEFISILANEQGNLSTNQYAKYSKNISDACSYMTEFFDKNITLEDIAKVANLSPVFFHTVFKCLKGKTPREYLLQIRLSVAKDMLENSHKPLSDVALLCGFESQSYFSLVFKKELGISPKKYRTTQQLII